VVPESGQRHLCGPDRAARLVCPLEHHHRPPGAREHDRGDEAVVAGPDDNRVEPPHAPVTRTSTTAGRPSLTTAAARCRAGRRSAGAVTRSPCAPHARATTARSGGVAVSGSNPALAVAPSPYSCCMPSLIAAYSPLLYTTVRVGAEYLTDVSSALSGAPLRKFPSAFSPITVRSGAASFAPIAAPAPQP